MSTEHSFNVLSGGCITITLDYKFNSSGAHVYPLVLKVLGARDISSYILKELVNIYDEALNLIVYLCLY